MDPLDKILANEDRLVPSSGFQSRVMDAVITEQARLPPLPFPWARFAAGVMACLAWAAAGAFVAERIDWSVFAPPLAVLTSSPSLGYAVAAIAASLVVVAVPWFRNQEI